MATRRWLGVVTAVKQINTLTVGGTIVIGDVFTIVCGYGTLTVTAAATTPASVAILLQAALAASTASPEFGEITWTVLSAVVTGTAKTAGKPFVVTSSATASATCVSASTACTGPNYANVAANWSGSTLPTTGDTVTIEADAPSILYGLTSNTDLLAKLTIESRFEGSIGLAEMNPAGYREYRAQSLSMNITALEVGIGGFGSGSPLLKIDLKATATAVLVLSTGSGGYENEPPLQLTGGTAATLIAVSGTIAIAKRITEVADYTTITTGAKSNLECGLTCTHTTIRSLGQTSLEAAVTTLYVLGGYTVTTGQITTLDVTGGILAYSSASTITSATVGPGTLDCSDLRARTITALILRQNGIFIDPQKTCTLTALTIAAGVKGLGAT